MANYPIFIIDGPDGTGKTTQALLWGQYFTLRGKKVSYFSFPVYEFPIGKAIGRCLGRWGEREKMPLPSPENMAVLYALNRLETLPYILSSITMEDDLILLNRGPYANLYNVARRILEDKINWETLPPEKKADKINSILELDREFLKAISDEREVVNIFLVLETEESIELAEQKALSTLGGEPDEYERKYELQALALQLYKEVARGEIPGHKAELVMATRGSLRRMWEGDLTFDGLRDEWFGVMATAHEISKVIFSHFYYGDEELVLRHLADGILAITQWIYNNSVVEGGVAFEFRKRWNLSAGLNPDLFGKRPLLAEEIQRSEPEVWEILQTSFNRDKEGLEANIKRERE